MQLLRLGAVLVACLLAVVGYVQEGRRLEVIRRLPGPQARDHYEAVRTRSDRLMWVLAVALLLVAVAAVFRVWTQTPVGAPT